MEAKGNIFNFSDYTIWFRIPHFIFMVNLRRHVDVWARTDAFCGKNGQRNVIDYPKTIMNKAEIGNAYRYTVPV